MKIKRPILSVKLTSAFGDRPLFVSRVTEKVIITICNDVCETYYRRDNGRLKGGEYSRFACSRIDSLRSLEEWLKNNGVLKNGVYVYDSGFRLACDSKGRLVRPLVEEAWKRACAQSESNFTYHMLKELGYQVLDLR